jgi:5S rRNA maturation endonuclease (ribonuclease M5)
VRYRGRNINPIVFWDRYVEFGNLKFSAEDGFSPKVQCPNPEHDTVKRHFQINFTEPKVHCFAYCGISGSWEHAICMIEGIYAKLGVDLEIVRNAYDKHPTARSVNEREQIRLHAKAKRSATKVILREAAGRSKILPNASVRRPGPGNSGTVEPISPELLVYETYLPAVAREYLDARGITGESIAQWNIGWHPASHRIVIPAYDETAHLKFLVKRAIRQKDQPKYLYTEGVPKTSLLFGAGQIDPGMIRSAGLILVEGSLDVVWMHQLGFKNVVAILGTGISDEQVRIVARMRPRKVFLMFDKDSAGVTNIQICAGKLRKYPMYVVKYPKGKSDPAELNREEAVRQIDRSVPLVKFLQATGLNVRNRRRRKEVEYVGND